MPSTEIGNEKKITGPTRPVSFRPKPAVAALLEAAEAAGLNVSDIVNEALVTAGSGIAEKMAQDARDRADSFLRPRKTSSAQGRHR